MIPALFTSDPAVQQQAHLLWPWLVAMMPVGGMLFAFDGVLFGSGDYAYLRTITLISAVVGYIPLAICALVFDWGIGGVWAGLTTFICLRFIAVLVRVLSGRWLVPGETR